LEEQEQYSRRTCLRCHVPVTPNDKPQNTDKRIIEICNKNLGVDIAENDFSRSHYIGKVRDGRGQIIAKFVRYRVREEIYKNKSKLKGNTERIFISEDLTQHRRGLVQRLALAKKEMKIFSFWTSDGKICAKKSEAGQKHIVQNMGDIIALTTT